MKRCQITHKRFCAPSLRVTQESEAPNLPRCCLWLQAFKFDSASPTHTLQLKTLFFLASEQKQLLWCIQVLTLTAALSWKVMNYESSQSTREGTVGERQAGPEGGMLGEKKSIEHLLKYGFIYLCIYSFLQHNGLASYE